MNRSGHREYILKPGYIFFTLDPTMILSVLGSSIAITFYDRENKCGGMNHFIYPWINPEVQPTALYAQPSIVQTLRMLKNYGSSIDNVEAHIIGGATPPESVNLPSDSGQNNIDVAIHLLDKYDIPIAGQEVGGRHGRKVLFDTESGELIIAKVEKIRKKDWLLNPYFDDGR
jgi:chemotaxis protein CheD